MHYLVPSVSPIANHQPSRRFMCFGESGSDRPQLHAGSGSTIFCAGQCQRTRRSLCLFPARLATRRLSAEEQRLCFHKPANSHDRPVGYEQSTLRRAGQVHIAVPNFSALKNGSRKFGDIVNATHKSIYNAAQKFSEIGTRTRPFKRKLRDVEELPSPESALDANDLLALEESSIE